MESIREYLKQNILLFDGAMGTYYAECTGDGGICESANINNPDLIKKIHIEYIDAGAKAILTNTFAASSDFFINDRKLQKDMIMSGIDIAAFAAEGKDIYIRRYRPGKCGE